MANNNEKTLVRIVLVSSYAIGVMKLVMYTMPDNVEFREIIPKQIFVFFYLFFFNFNTEGNLFFDRYLNKKLSWFTFPKKRLIIQLSFIFLWTLITIGLPFICWYYINGQSLAYPHASVIIFIGSVVFLIVYIGISVAINFLGQWKNSLLEVEHYKQEKLKADYRALQNQVNPHFLFNSLNVLISEINHDPKTAIEFTRKLSKVYRYVLQSKHHDLIVLHKEIEFIESFIYLHKIRIGDALEYSVNISDDTLQMRIPPLTLQILIENAIKHNIASKEDVLTISIKDDGDNKLIICNNLQPKESVDSTYTGLSNLSKRFELLKRDGFIYGGQNEDFVVTVPLIDE